MRIIDCQQGSQEWLTARAGIPTASNFDLILTTKGERSKQREKYLYRLAGERVTGLCEETYQNGAMLRGKEMESEARQYYELTTGEIVQQVGLYMTEGNAIYAASPDGIVGKDGLVEIKCPLIATQVSYLLNNELPSEYFLQTQGQLLVTERKWVDFLSYYPGLKPLQIRVKRDEKFIRTLRIELEIFCSELEEVIAKIK